MAKTTTLEVNADELAVLAELLHEAFSRSRRRVGQLSVRHGQSKSELAAFELERAQAHLQHVSSLLDKVSAAQQ